MVEEFSESWLFRAAHGLVCSSPVCFLILKLHPSTSVPTWAWFWPWSVADGHVDCTNVHDLARLCPAPLSLSSLRLHRGPGWAVSAQKYQLTEYREEGDTHLESRPCWFALVQAWLQTSGRIAGADCSAQPGAD